LTSAGTGPEAGGADGGVTGGAGWVGVLGGPETGGAEACPPPEATPARPGLPGWDLLPPAPTGRPKRGVTAATRVLAAVAAGAAAGLAGTTGKSRVAVLAPGEAPGELEPTGTAGPDTSWPSALSPPKPPPSASTASAAIIVTGPSSATPQARYSCRVHTRAKVMRPW
jgi:hypothetical protein